MLDRNIEALRTMAAAANLDTAVGYSPLIGDVNSLRELSMRALVYENPRRYRDHRASRDCQDHLLAACPLQTVDGGLLDAVIGPPYMVAMIEDVATPYRHRHQSAATLGIDIHKICGTTELSDQIARFTFILS